MARRSRTADADSFIDLTIDDEPNGDKKQKQKREKRQSKLRNPLKMNADQKPRKNRKVKGGIGPIGIVLIILIPLILVGGFAYAVIQFNFMELRGRFIDLVNTLDPAHAILDQRADNLAAWDSDLNARENALVSRDAQLDSREARLYRDTQELIARENRLRPLHRLPMSEQDYEDLLALSRIYTQMEAETAAGILLELHSINDVASILYHMRERNAASILAVMEPSTAARITDILMHY